MGQRQERATEHPDQVQVQNGQFQHAESVVYVAAGVRFVCGPAVQKLGLPGQAAVQHCESREREVGYHVFPGDGDAGLLQLLETDV